MKVIIASTNPIKIQAFEQGFHALFPDTPLTVEAVKGGAATSSVSDQPMSDDETYQGALNRANLIKTNHPEADYWVGIEGGVDTNKSNGLNAFAWVVILSQTQKGAARSASFTLPTRVVELINQGYELGEADDMVFNQTNTKKKSGAVGLLTNDAIDRAGLYAPAVTLALIPFKNESLYQQKIPSLDKTG